MVIPSGVVRVTVALDPLDVALLDRLAALEGSNRSAELRSILGQFRPALRSVVEALEAVLRTKEQFESSAAQAQVSELDALFPELQRLQGAYLGAMARLEGLSAAAAAKEDPRPSNHGGHTPLEDDSTRGQDE